MVSQTLQACLTTERDRQLLEKYELEKFNTLHKIILNDEGYPDLYQKIKDIHISIPDFNVFQYDKLYNQ